jgi:predicted aconitase with swiveling domain
MAKHVSAASLVPGRAQGATFVLQDPLSFWGGLDAASGRIIDRWHPQHGEAVSGRILVMAAGRGSSSGSSVLAEAVRLGTAPAGIVLMTRDPIVTVGAMIAMELYGKACPVVLAAPDDWPLIVASDRISIMAEDDRATIATTS